MFVHRPDARLFSLSFGQGPTTLFTLGGWVGSGEVWFDLFGHLPDWRCVAYDHRGSGASTHSSSPITVAAQVDDLFAVMDAQGVQRCILGAESAGVGIALEAAPRAPHRFSGLVLVDGNWGRPPPGSMDGFIARLEADYDAELKSFIARCLPEPNSEDARRWGLHILRCAAPRRAAPCREVAALPQPAHRARPPARHRSAHAGAARRTGQHHVARVIQDTGCLPARCRVAPAARPGPRAHRHRTGTGGRADSATLCGGCRTQGLKENPT